MKNNPIIDLAALYDEVSDMITERLVIEGAIKLDHNLFQFNDNIVDVQLQSRSRPTIPTLTILIPRFFSPEIT